MVEEFPLVAAATAPQEAAAGTNVKVTKADGNTSGGPDVTPSADQEKNWAMSLGCTMCNVMKEEAVTEFLRRVGWCANFKLTPGFLGQSTNDANYNLCSLFLRFNHLM